MEIDIYNRTVFKTRNFHLVDAPLELVIEAIAVMIGDYNLSRKWAAIQILKILLRDDFRKFLFESKELYPTDRNDSRVTAWKKAVLSRGVCEKCGVKESLEAHHVLHWADYPLGRFDINNGACLCHECHTNEHIGDRSYYMMKAGRSKKR